MNQIVKTIEVIDRNGNKTVYGVNKFCLAVAVEEFTNRNIRAGAEPSSYVTRREYNVDSEIVSVTTPIGMKLDDGDPNTAEGGRVEYTYDVSNPNRFAHGNLLTVRRVADKAASGGRGDGQGGEARDIVTTYTYEPIFQQVRTVTTPRGNDDLFSPPNSNTGVLDIDFDLDGTPDGDPDRSRYTTLYTYDYQELSATGIDALAQAEGIDMGPDADSSGDSDLAEALSLNMDVNADTLSGPSAQRVGNAVKVHQPVTVTESPSSLGVITGTQQIITLYRYNAFGLLIEEQDPEGFVDEYRYSPVSPDPNDTAASPATGNGGYLRQVVRDSGSLQITTTTNRDKVGNIVLVTDPIGTQYATVVNERNQRQKVTRDAASGGLAYVSRTRYDANDNVIATETENVVPSTLPSTLAGFSQRTNFSRGSNEFYVTRTTYDILDNPIRTEREVQDPGETVTILGLSFDISVPGSPDVVETRRFYDRNENMVLWQSPESVRGNQPNNVTSTIFDERDLPFKRTRGGIAVGFSALPAHENVALPGGVTTDSLTSTERLFYDANRNLVVRIDAEDNGPAGAPDGEPDAWIRSYDGFDRPVIMTDAFGNERVKTYDPESNVTVMQSFGPDGENKPASSGNRRLLSDTRTFYDELNRVFKTEIGFFESPLSPSATTNDFDDTYTSRTLFDANSRVANRWDARENRTSFSYDGIDRQIRKRDAAGNEVITVYDDNSNVTQTIEVETEGSIDEAYVTDTVYDTLNRPIMVVTNLRTDSNGNATIAGPARNATRYFYDSRDSVVATTDANSSDSVSFNTPAVTVATGSPLNRAAMTDPINDNGNRVYRIKDGLGRTIEVLRELRANHDGANMMAISSIQTATNYDGNSRVIARTDDRDNTTTYAYDTLNRLKTETFADNTTRTRTYDRDDNVITFTDQRGVVCTKTYDQANRMLEQSFDLSGVTDSSVAGKIEGTTRQTFEYDGLSRVTKAEDNGAGSTVSCSYDSLSRCLSESQELSGFSTATVGQTFDEESNRTAIIYPKNFGGGTRRVGLSFDSLNRPKAIESGTTAIASYDYLGPNRLGTRFYASTPTETTIAYDALRRPTAILHEGLVQPNTASAVDLEFRYAFDRVGALLAEDPVHEPSDTDLYEYDSLYRLTRETRNDSGATFPSNNAATNPTPSVAFDDDRRWTLDGVSNWIDETFNDGTTTTSTSRTRSNLNEYTDVGGVTRAHDKNGNVIDDGTFEYRYDALNRLVKVLQSATTTVVGTHAWDAKNRRVRHTITNSGTLNSGTRFVYAADKVIEERDSNDALTRQFVRGAYGELIQIKTPGVVPVDFYCFEKQDGSLAALSIDTGALASYYDYDVHGGVRELDRNGTDFFDGDDVLELVNPGPNSPTPYFFKGMRLTLETRAAAVSNRPRGLYVADGSARFYDLRNGRFMQRVGMWSGKSTMGLGNPYMLGLRSAWWDPFGWFSGPEKATDDKRSGPAKLGGVVVEPPATKPRTGAPSGTTTVGLGALASRALLGGVSVLVALIPGDTSQPKVSIPTYPIMRGLCSGQPVHIPATVRGFGRGPTSAVALQIAWLEAQTQCALGDSDCSRDDDACIEGELCRSWFIENKDERSHRVVNITRTLLIHERHHVTVEGSCRCMCAPVGWEKIFRFGADALSAKDVLTE